MRPTTTRKGVTAAFNLNLLARANRELGARFALDQFAHYAFYNAPLQRIEMHLVSRGASRAWWLGASASSSMRARACTPRTRTSSPSTACGRWRAAPASSPGPVWTDPQRLFSVHWLHAP
jgi:uncharacterized SAM-dependent methyltransferase